MSNDDRPLVPSEGDGKHIDKLNAEERANIEKKLWAEWSKFTDDERIQKILHYWIGAGTFGKKTDIDQPFLIVSPKKLLFWDDGEGNAAANFGEVRTLQKGITPTHLRGSFLDSFLQLEFIANHLLLVDCGTYSIGVDIKKILDLIRRMEVLEKINLLKKYGLIDSNDRKKLNSLRVFRNSMAHNYATNDAAYSGLKIHLSTTQTKAWDRICEDTNLILEKLISVYSTNQEPVIEWILTKLERTKTTTKN